MTSIKAILIIVPTNRVRNQQSKSKLQMWKIVTWEQGALKLQEIKIDFEKSYVCLNKSHVPSKTTQVKHLSILLGSHNTLVSLGKTVYPF